MPYITGPIPPIVGLGDEPQYNLPQLRFQPRAAPTGGALTGPVRNGRPPMHHLERPRGSYVRRSVSTLGDEEVQLQGIFSNIGKAVKKAVVDTGHVVGKVATSKIAQGVVGTALAVTGVGIPAAAAIMATQKGVGNLIKPGGNLKSAATGAAQGALTGAAAGIAGKVIKTVAPGFTGKAQDIANKLLPGTPFKRVAAATAGVATLPAAIENMILPPVADPIPSINVDPVVPFMQPGMKIGPATITPIASPMPILQEAPPSKIDVAAGVLRAGRRVKQATNSAAEKADDLAARAGSIAQAAQAASAAGDAAGASQLAELAARLAEAARGAQNIASAGAGDLRTAGNVAEGAAGGAVAGAAASSMSEFIANNKGLVYSVLAGVVLLGGFALTRGGGGGQTWNGGASYSRRRRAA